MSKVNTSEIEEVETQAHQVSWEEQFEDHENKIEEYIQNCIFRGCSVEGTSRRKAELQTIFRHRLNMIDGLCQTCRQCPAVEACGGGFVPHRWSAQNGFSNPSVYCADLYRLSSHVNRALGIALGPLLTGEKPVVFAKGA